MISLGIIKQKIQLKFIFQFLVIVALAFLIGALFSKLTPLLIMGLLVSAILFVFILKKPIWGIFLVALLLPFERLGSYEMSGLTIRPSQLVFILTLVCWITWALVHKKFSLAKNPIFWPAMVFIGLNVLSITNALNVERSTMVLLFTAFTILISFIIPNLVDDQEKLKKLIWFLLLGYLLVTLFGLFQFLGDIIGLPTSITGLREHYTKEILGFPRVQSTTLEPLYFANYLLLPISLLYAWFLSKSSKIKSLHLILLLALGVVNLILTVSRGGYIALAVSIIVVSLFLVKKIIKPKNIAIILIILVIIGLVSVRFLNLDNAFEKFKEHALAIFYGASYNERVYTFEQAQIIWQQNPIIGQGPGSFGPYLSAHPYVTPPEGWNIVNNEPLELLAETGILGLLAIIVIALILIFRTIKAIRKANNPYLKAIAIGLLAAFLGVVVQYQTFSILYITHIWFLIGLMVAVQNIILIKNKDA